MFRRFTLWLNPINSLALVQSLSPVQLFVLPWTAAHQASLSFSICWSLLKLMSIKLVMPSNHLILCYPLLLLPSIFPNISVFSIRSLHQVAKVLELYQGLCTRWLKYWSCGFSISPSNRIFSVDFLWDWLVWAPYSPSDSWNWFVTIRREKLKVWENGPVC